MGKKFTYQLRILEHHLDSFGHVNNATYLEILEQARWEWTTQGGYGLNDIKAKGIGPIVTEINIRFRRELLLREEIRIESECTQHRLQVATIEQRIYNHAGKLCTVAELKVCLFDTATRKLAPASAEWLRAIGIED